jgi:hypothetical protein
VSEGESRGGEARDIGGVVRGFKVDAREMLVGPAAGVGGKGPGTYNDMIFCID